jgi:N-acetylglucosamine-6-sulfatase
MHYMLDETMAGYYFSRMRTLPLFLIACLLAVSLHAAEPTKAPKLEKIPGAKPRNIVFILTDDHRYDAMGFMGHPFLETPNMDYLAKSGVHLKNAFVTTSLCSPSRASILTGLYPCKHKIVDNNTPSQPGTIYFSQYLKQAGYQTAFFGKWHMGGDGDDPQPGWDHWVSFRGQGSYLPNKNGLNVDGKHVPQKGYITDELTDYAMDWLNGRDLKKPFMMYLSHKAVHAEFIPADRHKGRYAGKRAPVPAETTANDDYYKDKPMWLKNQRNSWHGVDFPYHSDLNIDEYYQRYCETLLAVDESVGRVLDWLRSKKLLDSTLIVYMGDNGFMFGEHGLIDKRVAYETSMRVPMMMSCPELFRKGTVIDKMVANIDIAPTFLEVAGLKAPAYFDGQSFVALAQQKEVPWREFLLYTYFWERNFPQTPTMHALREDQYKFIRYYGVWDTDELYDIRYDPKETKNLINDPEHKAVVARMRKKLFEELEKADGMNIPLFPDRGNSQNLRRKAGSKAADFPDFLMRNKSGKE